ncbi:hypothetical protein PV328_005964 [Microctonus aethiopoides]|uniref:Endonuclease n=1 Tax=Microctonus aethiopoides TaxID=144406 RepID=A0AA39KT14_9HYME|nr:hypothetical protein PV328_005964 [Microctonus aethiopoides]
MKYATSIMLKLSAIASASVGGWYAGLHYERIQQLNNDKNKGVDTFSCSNFKLKPGIPIFGTVSAATPFIPDENNNSEMGLKFSSSSGRMAQIMKYGFPGLDSVRIFDDFVLSYDRRNRVAHWVFEHLTKENLHKSEDVDRSKSVFKSDESIHPFFRSSNSDYKGSGYDRGHMAAAGNHQSSQEYVHQTFNLSNIAPQVGAGFNRDSWNRLESHVRKLTRVYTDVHVCTGPLYLPKKEKDGKKYVKYEVIGSNHVAVPTHFFKIVVGETKDSKYEMEAYVMPNAPIDDNIPLTSFQVPPESIERAAGLLFFDKLSRSRLTKINGKKV